jgi:EpsI family protein
MLSYLQIGAAGLVFVGLLALYWAPLAAMVRVWDASPMYSYAYTVPAISLFLVWSRRAEFRTQRCRPARTAGAMVMAVAIVTLAMGEIAALQVLQQLSLIPMVAGLVLFMFGADYLKLATPALAYSVFMIPLWDAFTEPLHGPFQTNSARLGVALMRAIGVPVYREGTTIALSNATLEVARECSGVNYLIAVLALAIPLSCLRLQGGGRRVLLVGFALLVAALANGLRVALIGTLVHLDFGSPLHGPFHVLHGLFVAGVGYAALFAGLGFLETRQCRVIRGPAPGALAGTPIAFKTFDAMALAVVLWAVAFVGPSPRLTPVALAMPLDFFPTTLGDWHAAPIEGELAASAWDDADHRLQRRYVSAGGREVLLEVWYFEYQQQGREIVNFKADALHQRATPHRVRLATDAWLTVNIVRLEEDIALFWYEVDGVAETRQYAAKLRSLWKAISSRRSNGAAVMLRTPSDAGEQEAVKALDEMAAELHPRLARHWIDDAPTGPVVR